METIKDQIKFTIFMIAYNAEAYLEETILSVLAQTEPSWEFVLCDNGSTDSTGEIAEYYARQDKRIRVFHNRINLVNDNGAEFGERKFFPEFYGEYVTNLDADDLLVDTFLEDTYAAAEKYHADIVVAGTVFFLDGEKPYLSDGYRVCPACVIEDDAAFAQYFSEIYSCFRPIWGKIFRKEFFEEHYIHAWEGRKGFMNGGDTFVSLGYLEKAKCIVGLDKVLHAYRKRVSSGFHTLDLSNKSRIHLGKILFQRGYQCLQTRNSLTQQNIHFLHGVWAGHFLDLLNLLKKVQCNPIEKILYLQEMLQEKQEDLYFFNYAWESLNQYVWNVYDVCIQDASKNHPSSCLWEYYSIRLYDACKKEENGSYLQFVMYYSALCDQQNNGRIGIQELSKRQPYCDKEKILIERAAQNEYLMDFSPENISQYFINTTFEMELRKLKEILQQQIENLDLEVINDMLDAMEKISPLDFTVLYVKSLIAWESGKIDLGLQLLYCAKVFYPNDETIAPLYQEMKEFYQKNIL